MKLNMMMALAAAMLTASFASAECKCGECKCEGKMPRSLIIARLRWAKSVTEARVFEASKGVKFNYRYWGPEKIEAGRKYPLVVFLHGAGERGDNNVMQLIHGVPEVIDYCDRKGLGAFVIAGQVSGRKHPTDPAGYKWSQVPWEDITSQPLPREPSEAMGALIELIEKFRANPAVDTSRIYVTGISMGGYGTWDIIMRKPEWFAAAMPICGGADDSQMARVKDIPIHIFHGDADTAVNPQRARNAYAALKAVGGKVELTMYPGVNHNSWRQTYVNDENFDWLFAQKKPVTK